MTRLMLLVPLLAALAFATTARAERVPSHKTEIVPSSGARPDITVPFLTNGRSTLGVANGVAPIILQQPGLGTANDAQLRPVFNLIYYGSQQGPNSSFMGAIPREPNRLRPGR